MNERTALGQRGEQLAADYLQKLGWRIVERNWRYLRLGEIDIIAVEPSARQGALVFCEVKTKSGHGFGDPLEAITREKLKRLHRLACMWMATHTMGYDQVRIDAIGVTAIPGEDVEVNHAKAVRL